MHPSIHSIPRYCAAAAILAASASASAVPVSIWNVGSGQRNENFVTTDATLDGLDIELGLRAQHRQALTAVPFTPPDIYSVRAGSQDGTVEGEPVAPDRAHWNFDYHVN